MTNLILTNEIAGAMAPTVSASDRDAVIKAIGADVAFVDNTNGEVNLCLPYYASLDNVVSSEITDADITDIIGGEIGVSIALTVVGIGAAAAFFGGGAAISIGAGQDKSK